MWLSVVRCLNAARAGHGWAPMVIHTWSGIDVASCVMYAQHTSCGHIGLVIEQRRRLPTVINTPTYLYHCGSIDIITVVGFDRLRWKCKLYLPKILSKLTVILFETILTIGYAISYLPSYEVYYKLQGPFFLLFTTINL